MRDSLGGIEGDETDPELEAETVDEFDTTRERGAMLFEFEFEFGSRVE